MTTTTMVNTAATTQLPAGSLVPDCPSWCRGVHDLFDWEPLPREASVRLYHRAELGYDIETGLSVSLVAAQDNHASPERVNVEPATAQVETAIGDWYADDLERCGRMLIEAAARMREHIA